MPLLAACNPGVPEPPQNEAEPARNAGAATPTPPRPLNTAAPANEALPAPEAAPPARDPGLAAMSPYRRREYERGYRDCMTGNFDRERQGESYRIGCMAAEEARARR